MHCPSFTSTRLELYLHRNHRGSRAAQTQVMIHTLYNLTTQDPKHREYVYCSVAVYQKYPTRLGELIIFKLWPENYHFSQQS